VLYHSVTLCVCSGVTATAEDTSSLLKQRQGGGQYWWLIINVSILVFFFDDDDPPGGADEIPHYLANDMYVCKEEKE
jgi:hypothetical protein